MNVRPASLLASLVLLQSPLASAQTPPPALGGRLEAEAGIAKSTGSDFEGCLELELRAMLGTGLLQGGAEIDLGTALLANHRVGGAFVMGIATQNEGPQFLLLGQAGLHSYHHVCGEGCGLFDKTSGGEGTVPFFGLHIGLAIPFGRSAKNGASFILSLTPRIEPWSTTTQYSFVESELLSDRTTTGTSRARLGGTLELGAGIGAAVVWN